MAVLPCLQGTVVGGILAYVVYDWGVLLLAPSVRGTERAVPTIVRVPLCLHTHDRTRCSCQPVVPRTGPARVHG